MAGATTVISSQTVVNGRIAGEEDLDVFGTVKGSIEISGDLLVDSGARVEAEINAHAVEIMGIVVGNVQASTSVRIHDSALVAGDITTPRLLVADGAKYRGFIDMGGAQGSSAKPNPRTTRKPSSRSRAKTSAPAEPAQEVEDAEEEPKLPAGTRAKKVKVKRRA